MKPLAPHEGQLLYLRTAIPTDPYFSNTRLKSSRKVPSSRKTVEVPRNYALSLTRTYSHTSCSHAQSKMRFLGDGSWAFSSHVHIPCDVKTLHYYWQHMSLAHLALIVASRPVKYHAIVHSNGHMQWPQSHYRRLDIYRNHQRLLSGARRIHNGHLSIVVRQQGGAGGMSAICVFMPISRYSELARHIWYHFSEQLLRLERDSRPTIKRLCKQQMSTPPLVLLHYLILSVTSNASTREPLPRALQPRNTNQRSIFPAARAASAVDNHTSLKDER